MRIQCSAFLKLLALAGGIQVSGSAQGALAIQTLYGLGAGNLTEYRSTQGVTERTRLDTDKLTAAVHVDPFKSIPVTLGLFYSTFHGESEKEIDAVAGVSGFDYGWEVLTWTRVGSIGMSLRYGQALGGNYEVTVYEGDNPLVDQSESTFDYSVGYNYVGLGFALPMTAKLGALLEFRQRISSQFELAEGSTKNDVLAKDFDGGMVFLGVEFGL